MWPKWPNHCNLHSKMKSAIDVKWVNSYWVIHSFYCTYLVTPKMVWTQRLWKAFNKCTSGALVSKSLHHKTKWKKNNYSIVNSPLSIDKKIETRYLQGAKSLDDLAIRHLTSQVISQSTNRFESKYMKTSTISIVLLPTSTVETSLLPLLDP